MPDPTASPDPAAGHRAAPDRTPRWPTRLRPRRSSRPRGHARWRIGTPVVMLVCGGLFVVSAVESDGTDLRPAGTTDLASVVAGESRDVQALKTHAAGLDQDVQALTAGVDDKQVNQLTRRIHRLEPAAGRTPVAGPGVSVTLSDAPLAKQKDYSGNINDLLVHQQDIQATVNALWLGGARAVTLQGQRLIATTGIKCSGNVVRLHGIPYAEPYVVRAVGDPARLERALTDSRYLQIYRQYVADPDIDLGWSAHAEARVLAPAYAAPLDLSYAQVATSS